MIKSYGAKISITLSESRRSLCRITLTYGLTSAIDSLADSALDLPMSEPPWMIWRCRFDSSTVSTCKMPSVPTRAAPRHSRLGHHLTEPGGDQVRPFHLTYMSDMRQHLNLGVLEGARRRGGQGR